MLALALVLVSTQLAGLELKDALELLRDDGFNLVYSSRLVRPDMRVEEEPERESDRKLLEQLLGPHGLTVKPGPEGTWIVIREERPKKKETKREPGDAPDPDPTTFSLSVLPRFHQEVEVTGRRDTSLMGLGEASLEIDVSATKDVAGGLDNPFRALATLPGVTPTSELGSLFSVRGGAPEQNLLVLDGVELYNPFRLHGVASALHPETLDTMELATSGFGVPYGDRLASVLAVETRRGTSERYLAGAFDMSATDASLVFEGKLPGVREGAWLVSGRRTHYDLILESVFDDEFPFFADVQTKWSMSPREGQELSFTGLVGKEDMRLRPNQLDAGERAVSDEDYEVGARSRTKLFAFNFDTTVGTRFRSKTTVSVQEFTDAFAIEGGLRSAALESPNGNPLGQIQFSRGLEVRDRAARQSFFFDWRARHALSFGFEAHVLDTLWHYRVGDLRSESHPTAKSISFESLGLPGASLPAALDSEVDSVRSGLWVEDRIRWNDRWILTPGLRLDYSTLNRRASLSPRFRASFLARPRTRLRFEASLYHQSPGYEKLFLADRFVDLSDRATRERLDNDRAFVLGFGLDQELAPGARLRFDAYHKRFHRLVIGRLETEAERLARLRQYDFPAELSDQIPRSPRVTVHPTSDGRGSASGFEVSIEKAAGSWLTGWASYSFLKASQSAYGRSFPLDYDATHAASFVARAQLTKSIALSLTGRVSRGYPRTPALAPRVAATRSDAGTLVPMTDDVGELVYTTDFGDVSNLNASRLPAFARLDFRFTHHTGGGEGGFIWYVEILNLLNRANTMLAEPRVRFTDGVPRIEEDFIDSIPVLPSFGIRFRF